jgi:hypothetical protein
MLHLPALSKAGQQIWLDYMKPYINDYMVDVYGTAVGVINPKRPIQSGD